MKKPLVSIITPTYNSSKFINETVQSVRNQTYQNFEHIIVDDCSSDNTWMILEDLEKRIPELNYCEWIKIQVQRWLVTKLSN